MFHINEIMQYMAFCVWLISLCMIFSRFIHVVVGIRTSFLFMAEQYSSMWIYHILHIHSSVVRYLHRFHFLTILNSAAMNICVQVFI